MNWLHEKGLDNLSSNIAIGDTLQYNASSFGDRTKLVKVVAVGKSTCKCDDGSIWTLRTGRKWGSSSSWRSTYAYVVRDMAKVEAVRAAINTAKVEEAKRHALISEVQSWVPRLTTDELTAMASIVDGVKLRSAAVSIIETFVRWAR